MVKNKAISIDRAFGVHTKFKRKFMIGGSLVDFINDVMFDKTKNTKYKFSLGLAKLVFKKDPNFNVVTDNDESQYLQILTATNPHRMGNESTRKLKQTNKGNRKYKAIIELLLLRFDKIPKSPQGKGLPKYKMVKSNSSSIDYIFWDDPNELVDRLRLLMAEQQAGNGAHSNEILAIVEELREAGYML